MAKNRGLKSLPRQGKARENDRVAQCRILIVTEGKSTEPNYFKNFKDIQRVEIEILGEGKGPTTLVEYALRERAKYDQVWVVFDKDDVPKDRFDNAINKAQEEHINVAWSNEAFELWYILHFRNVDWPIERHHYKRMLSQEVAKVNRGYRYDKTATDHYAIMEKYGNQSEAIRRAKALVRNDRKYNAHNPCTMVYQLVEQLNHLRDWDEKDPLVQQILSKMN